jgi:hypothetical protein
MAKAETFDQLLKQFQKVRRADWRSSGTLS